jgi:ubiquinone/menaquinone biosynthesis C-methylase UbiE
MGFYRDRILPRLVDRICGDQELAPLRERVCAGLSGEVVELGFGSGTNLPFYPATVSRVQAVEPADLAWRLAADRLAASAVPVERAGTDGQRLPFADDSADAALVTFTLCTVPDPVAALREVHRVLVPGGRLHFLEHGLAPDAAVRRWQRRVEPVQKRLAGGCHLTRPIVELVEQGGFTVETVDEFYLESGPKFGGACSLGIAVRQRDAA